MTDKLLTTPRILAFIFILVGGVTFMNSSRINCHAEPPEKQTTGTVSNSDLRNKDDAYWKSKLTPEQYEVTRKGGTERPFTGKYYHFDGKGDYVCSSCDQVLFSSDHKFDSGSGWPSFYDLAEKGAVELKEDSAHGMQRTEVICSRCGAHLGHLFDDGPNPTGKRYCINSASLDFKESKNQDSAK